MSELKLVNSHGCLYLQGEAVNSIANSYNSYLPVHCVSQRINRDGPNYHITIISSDESKDNDICINEIILKFENFSQEKFKFKNDMINRNDDIFRFIRGSHSYMIDRTVIDIGYGIVKSKSSESYYCLIFSELINQIRASVNLPYRLMHITLGFSDKDIHHKHKDISNLINCSSFHNLIHLALILMEQNFEPNSPYFDLFEFIIRKLNYSIENKLDYVNFLKLGAQYLIKKSYFHPLILDIGYILLNLGYLIGFKFILIYKIRNQEEIDIKSLTESSHVNSPVSIHKKADIFKSINILISKFMNHYDRVVGINPIRDDGKVCEFFLPRNFSWINSERTLAGSARPSKDEHICGLFNNGIRHIITLQEFPLEILDKYSKYIKSSYFYVVDRTPLTIEQLEKCCTLIHDSLSNNESVLIHCQGGIGRTNMAIAAYLMKYKNFSMSEALESLQQHRKVLLTVSQTQTLKNWWGFIHNKELDDKMPITNLLDSKRPSMNILKFLPNVLLLCGYAASGKSTFSKTLLSAYPNIFVRINKDEMRGKGEIDKMIFEYMNEIKENKKVLIIDCCNLTVKARLEWIDCFKSFVIWCLYFNIPIEECKYRIKLRVDHPTILDGNSGQKILTTMEKIIEPPTQSEGFEKLIIFNSENCIASTLKEWHINPSTLESSIDSIRHGIIKFPKIPHLFNLGGATRDDKICTPSDISKFIGQKVIIEEKIDGANVGISIDDNGCILVQNRSHFITSNYHAQFAPLDKWIAKHMSDLWEILTPNRHILFGEWVYATHSIPYDLLPGWFIAYDLYDKVNNTFMSRSKLAILLKKSNIPYVPVIFEDYIENIESLKSYVTGKSKYSSHAVREGIVIRVFDDENNLKFRAKIVRGDFLAGNERWNKLSKLATNSLIIQ